MLNIAQQWQGEQCQKCRWRRKPHFPTSIQPWQQQKQQSTRCNSCGNAGRWG
jgi:hypothetical protein